MSNDLIEELRFEKDSNNIIAGHESDRNSLPIMRYRDHILYSLEIASTVIVVGETGCGKSTQIPQILYEAGWNFQDKVIAVSLPRRIATISLAMRVSQEMRVKKQVSYKIRFDDKTSNDTKIKFITDGALIREIMCDPLLTQYSVIMVDDAHERSIYTDLLLSLLKKIKVKRKDLRVIISSATIDAESYAEFFHDKGENIQILSIEGRTYPVDVYYLEEPCADYIKKAAETVKNIHESQPRGDILVFLTGQEDIHLFLQSLQDTSGLEGLPLYSGLSTEKQMEVFSSHHSGRRVIASTNIAETSITIEGICYVVDCCFVKAKIYNPASNTEYLNVIPISKAQASQRAGRAGRIRPGKCYRLCTESAFINLQESSVPEILRSDLTSTVLFLKSLGIRNIPNFQFIDQPNKTSVVKALEVLYSLGAIDDFGELTKTIGYQIAEFPIDPRFSVMLLNSCKDEFHCSREMLEIVSMLSIQNLFSGKGIENALWTKRKLGAKEGDHICLLNIFENFNRIQNFQERKRFCQEHKLSMRALQRAYQIKEQLYRIMGKFKCKIVSCDGDVEGILRCLVTGLFANAAQRNPNGTYKTVKGDQLFYLHPTSILGALKPPWVVFTEVIQQDKPYICEVSEIDADWLSELAPHYFSDTRAMQLQIQHRRLQNVAQ
ncbi:DHX35 [Blepharisma stoltei]|uniref:RNA helicase n=1 Tax=Blepharisma stoltei TaxID=1481888 RepID=A0AAU9IYW0_9CILI|nr:unnamed protein product [Blepharisma stoltei]